MDHNVTVMERPQNFEQYRWEATCTCAWQGRVASKEAAESMASAHGTLIKQEAPPTPPPADAVTATTATDTTKGTTPKKTSSKDEPLVNRS